MPHLLLTFLFLPLTAFPQAVTSKAHLFEALDESKPLLAGGIDPAAAST